MKRAGLVCVLVGVPLAALVLWISRNTYWAEVSVPMPLKGEALRNPFYPVQRLAEQLGARTEWNRVLTLPPTDSVIVLADWHWSLSAGRRQALERWVESGGRLVVEASLIAEDEFEKWSGIVREYQFDKLKEIDPPKVDACRVFHQAPDSSLPHDRARYTICSVSIFSYLTSSETPLWTLRDEAPLLAVRDAPQVQAMRVRRGRGTVTAVNASPFHGRRLFDGDHALLFVAATQLRRGDEVHFLSERDHPSLLALLWDHGAPVVVLALVLVALALWRGWVRIGPLARPAQSARRSLAEQIRGTSRFAVKHGGGEALHAASVRALDEAAARRIPRFAQLPADERTAALERLTGSDRHGLAEAIYHPRVRHAHELRNTIATLESARRRIQAESKSSKFKVQSGK